MTDDKKSGWTKFSFAQSIDDLIEHGPSLPVSVGALPFDANAARPALAQIDTGATSSAISRRLAEDLGLKIVSDAVAHMPGLESVVTPCYRVFLILPFADIPELIVADLPTLQPPHDVLLGRDILARCRLGVDFTTGVTCIHLKLDG